MRIKLLEIIGPECVSLDQGQKLYYLLFNELKGKNTVEVDFQGIETLYSPFLMGSLGKLLGHYDKEKLMQELVFCNITSEHLKSVNEFIDRAENQLTEQGYLQTMRELFEEDELGDL
ncbi:MAG: STAS-like domain-containing protein [Nitrospinota bacterium]|nr:STAS-like domain-containing protein [Nitrospinota bacterium]